jgi:hypothetical protein
VINGIESAIDGLVNQIPGGQSVKQDIKAAFVNLLDRVVRESVHSVSTPAAAGTPATPAASVAQRMPDAKAPGSVSALWKDSTLQGLEQLSTGLTAEDTAYDEREGLLRNRLNVTELEKRLRGYAESMGVEYSSTDLDGILRNAGYGAAHLGSSDRYMASVEHFTNEAYKNYRERAGNVPGLNA